MSGARTARVDDQEAIDAELGYSVRGEREVKHREWFSLREEGEGPRTFKLLIKALQARRYWREASPERRARMVAYRKQWAAEHPEAVKKAVQECKRRQRKAKTPAFLREVANKRARRRRELVERHASAVYTCTVCGAQWCTALHVQLPKKFKPKYCGSTCRGRACYSRRLARAAAPAIPEEGPTNAR